MTRLALLLLLSATLAAEEAAVLVRGANGQTVELSTRIADARPHIVEFREPPLAVRGRAAAVSYRETFDRFRRDLGGARSRIRTNAAPRAIEHEYFRTFHGVSVTLDASDVAAVRALPYVKSVHEDERVRAYADEDTTRLARIGAERVWAELNSRGEGITVAVLDTGIDPTHPALAGKIAGGWDFVDADENPADEHGHGTHVAGIVAGEAMGVAPAARLLDYRVLNKYGEGSTSDIIAALEWVVDPDRDGNLSDHADVANLSLGGRGDADSPLSLAVDRAVEAGVVVCLAAGNTAGGQTIGAPASSRLGLTIGNSDAADAIAPSSSRGPAFPDLALKPEITAPGTLIISAKLGGGTIAYSGTSMAAPHVAGAAALLLALHREWTPAQVKAALVGHADRINDEVMAQGGGRLNVYAAAGSRVSIEPAALTFGNGREGTWTQTRVVRVTNHAATTQTFSAVTDAPPATTIAASPQTFELAPGASRDVTLTATIAEAAEPSAVSLSVGGRVSFRSDAGVAHVPWVAIDAARVNVVYDAPAHQAAMTWSCDNGGYIDARRDGNTWDALLPYRTCELRVFAAAMAEAAGSSEGELSLLFESHRVTDDLQLRRSPADSVHAVRLAGVDANGAVIAPPYSDEAPYYVTYDFGFGAGRPGYGVGTFATAPLHVNTIPAGVTITPSQVWFDFPRHRILSIHHQPLDGVASSVTLSTLPSDLRHARLRIEPQRGDVEILPTFMWVSGQFGFGRTQGNGPSLARAWEGDVYITPEPNPKSWGGPALTIGRLRLPDPTTDVMIETLRAIGDRIVLSSEPTPSPAAYGVPIDNMLTISTDRVAAGSFVDTRGTAFAVFPSFLGPAGERVLSAARGIAFEIRDASGTSLREATADYYVSADFGRRDAYRAELRARDSQLALSFDTSREDANPPTLSSFRILRPDGTIYSRESAGQPATLAFSVADYVRGDDQFIRFAGIRSMKASWRAAGGAWEELPVTLVLEDRGHPREIGHVETGLHYRASLGALTALGGPIDVRIEMEDESGNTSTVIVEDAAGLGGRRRGVRR